MKAVFVAYNQVHTTQIQILLDRFNVRGFTRWESVQGRGSNDGEPHLGSHAWPGMNSAMIIFVEDEKVQTILEALRKMDNAAPQQGLHAFTWTVDSDIF